MISPPRLTSRLNVSLISLLHSLSPTENPLCVTAPDPEYGFKKKLELKKKGKTKRKVEMKCAVDSPDAKVKWYKDGKEIKGSDPRYLLCVSEIDEIAL